MVKVGKCALIGLMHKKWTLRVELTQKKLATVRVEIFFENADYKMKGGTLCIKFALAPWPELAP